MAIENPTKIVDITIIGAGPTGLFSAYLARQLGLSVCILEKRAGPLEVGRADALNARTQQIFDVVSILKELRAAGLQCNTSSVFKDGRFQSRQNQWWTNIQDSYYKEFLMIGQSYVEKVLVKHLDINVRYNTKVDYVQEGVGYVKTGYGVEVVRSRYLIAADGAHSFVRKQLCIQFEGEAPNMCWAVLDTFLETNFPVCDEIISFESNSQSRVSWIPRERGMARFYILLDGEVTEERSKECIRHHMAPYKVQFMKTEWFSTYNVQERVAATYISLQHQRIFLAGDAAHVHAVNGGQGLNTGISDAFALIWRLNLVCKGFHKSLLQSYDTERRLTARGVVDVAGKLVRSTLGTAKDYVGLVEKNAANITGMGIIYPPTSVAIGRGAFSKFISGARCPDFEFTKSTVVCIRFYELFNITKFVVLKPTGLQVNLAPILLKNVELWEVSKKDGYFEVTTSTGLILATEFPLGEEMDIAIVVRPDLYVGYVGGDVEGYFKFLF